MDSDRNERAMANAEARWLEPDPEPNTVKGCPKCGASAKGNIHSACPVDDFGDLKEYECLMIFNHEKDTAIIPAGFVVRTNVHRPAPDAAYYWKQLFWYACDNCGAEFPTLADVPVRVVEPDKDGE